MVLATHVVCFYMLNASKVVSALLFTNYLSEIIHTLFQELFLGIFPVVRIIPCLINVTLMENINLKLELCPTPSIQVSFVLLVIFSVSVEMFPGPSLSSTTCGHDCTKCGHSKFDGDNSLIKILEIQTATVRSKI